MFWIIIIVAGLVLLYFRLINSLTYWSQKSVPQKTVFEQLKTIGNILFQKKAQAELFREMYNVYPEARYVGSYSSLTPLLVLRDLELIKQITVKDFDHFTDHTMFVPEEMEPLWSKNLFSLQGDKWRDMRATLSPSFSSSKMKAMFILMNECAEQFVQHFKNNEAVQLVELKGAFTKFANDVIASAAFGITCDSLKDPNNEFYMMGKEATNLRGVWLGLKFFTILVFPKLAKMLGVKIFSEKASEFFRRLVKINIESREKNGIVRPDMIHILMEAKNGRLKHEDHKDGEDFGFAVIEESPVGKDVKRVKRQLTDDDLVAQVLVFFFAGFESVSTLMCFLFYEVAVNPDVQETLRKEVEETIKNCGGSLTYDALIKMKYLDMVVSEALRKWPAQIIVDRACVKPYTIHPVKDGELPVHLKKGDSMCLPIFAIQRDPNYYPNPDLFDPERFSDENKSNINPYSYLPFGAGPRSCIGNRFALLETKTILFNMILNFEITVAQKTTVPIKLAKDTLSLDAEGGFWLELKPLRI